MKTPEQIAEELVAQLTTSETRRNKAFIQPFTDRITAALKDAEARGSRCRATVPGFAGCRNCGCPEFECVACGGMNEFQSAQPPAVSATNPPMWPSEERIEELVDFFGEPHDEDGIVWTRARETALLLIRARMTGRQE